MGNAQTSTVQVTIHIRYDIKGTTNLLAPITLLNKYKGILIDSRPIKTTLKYLIHDVISFVTPIIECMTMVHISTSLLLGRTYE